MLREPRLRSEDFPTCRDYTDVRMKRMAHSPRRGVLNRASPVEVRNCNDGSEQACSSSKSNFRLKFPATQKIHELRA